MMSENDDFVVNLVEENWMSLFDDCKLMIEVEGLLKFYGIFVVVCDVFFIVKEWELVVFLGLNGVGKSMMMKMLIGYFFFLEGMVWIFGYDMLIDCILGF